MLTSNCAPYMSAGLPGMNELADTASLIRLDLRVRQREKHSSVIDVGTIARQNGPGTGKGTRNEAQESHSNLDMELGNMPELPSAGKAAREEAMAASECEGEGAKDEEKRRGFAKAMLSAGVGACMLTRWPSAVMASDGRAPGLVAD